MRGTRVFLRSTEYVTAVSLSGRGIRRSVYLHDWNVPLYTRNTFYHLKQFADRLTMSLDTCAHMSGRKVAFFSRFLAAPILLPRGYLRDVDQREVDSAMSSKRFATNDSFLKGKRLYINFTMS